MGTYTEKLNLYLTDMDNDGNDSFDFDRDLNDNFEKIDDYVASNETNLATKADKSYVDPMLNSLYEGQNLETVFASEIANYSSVYAWLQARKNSGNYTGIHIGDYFYVSISAGTIAGYSISAQTFKCRIVGLNTYKGCGDTEIGNMIYCISDEVIDTPILWNPNNNNNGTATNPQPWLASAMYAVLNGVNNYRKGYNNVYFGANGGNGIISLLPSSLRNVLVTKRNLLDERYSASAFLTGGTSWTWQDMGKLWLPNEVEVYGAQFKSNTCQTSGWWNPENNLSIQFPWFALNCEHRVKRNSGGSRACWWLSSPASHNTAGVCRVDAYGYANRNNATYASFCAPLCFCI